MREILEVIIPVHNIHDRQESLSKLLSVGTIAEASFIVVSDSSSEVNHSAVKSIVSTSLNPNSKVITGNFGSPGLARNAGLSIAEARWVAFLDSDDEIDVNALLKLISNAEEVSAQMGIGGIIFDSKKSRTKFKYFIDPNISILANFSLTPAFTRMVFQRVILSGINFPEFKMAEDQCFLIEVLESSPKMYLEEVYFYTYHLGDVGQSTRSRSALRDLPLAISHIASRLSKFQTEMQQFAITMIVRQSTTYLLSIGARPKKGLFRVIQILALVSLRHPVMTVGSLVLILMHRPKSF